MLVVRTGFFDVLCFTMSSEFEFDCPNSYFELSTPFFDLCFHDSNVDEWFRTIHPLHEKPVVEVVEAVPKKTPTKRKSILGASRRESISKKNDADSKPSTVFAMASVPSIERRGHNNNSNSSSSGSSEKPERKRPSSQVAASSENVDVSISSTGSNSAEKKGPTAPAASTIKKKAVAMAPVASSIGSSSSIRSKVESVPSKKVKTTTVLSVPQSKVTVKPNSRAKKTVAPTAPVESVLFSVKEVREWEKITGILVSRCVAWFDLLSCLGLVWAHLNPQDKERANDDMCRMKMLHYVPRV